VGVVCAKGGEAVKPPYAIQCDDGSISIEFISKTARFGITVENDPGESGWYFVSKSGDHQFGTWPEEMATAFRQFMEHLRQEAKA
jgi:S-formylglutathione hydrolase FrmB